MVGLQLHLTAFDAIASCWDAMIIPTLDWPIDSGSWLMPEYIPI
jgi:hypothetical protein